MSTTSLKSAISLESPGTASSELSQQLNSAFCRVRDLESRLSSVLEQQLEVREALASMRDPEPEPAPTSLEEARRMSRRPSLDPAPDLQQTVQTMVMQQRTWLDNVKERCRMAGKEKRNTKVFKDIERHLLERMQFLELCRALVEGPLYVPPPPEEPEPEPSEEPEEQPEEEQQPSEQEQQQEEPPIEVEEEKTPPEKEKKGKKGKK